MAEILKNHIRISSLNVTNPSLAAQLKSELNKQFETLKAMVYLNFIFLLKWGEGDIF